MAVTFGFYNSLNGDRKYNAIQMSSIFDGIIEDGVYQSIGQAFLVSAATGTEVYVGTGRAWFNHTWTLNDSIYTLDLGSSEMLLNRYDAVVIEVNSNDAVRANAIKVIHGTPASTPSKPTMTRANGVFQYPLAYIYRGAETTSIRAADITNTVGTSECPFVIGVLKVLSIDGFLAQWQDQWNVWFNNEKREVENEWYTWFSNLKHISDTDLTNWISDKQGDFLTWFNSLQVLLEGDVAANLANQIVKLNKLFDDLAIYQTIFRSIEDHEGDSIRDHNGDPINGDIKFCIEPCGCCK